MKPAFSIANNGDSALDIRFEEPPSEALSRYIIVLAQEIRRRDFPGIADLVPAYQCLTVAFDPLIANAEELPEQLETLVEKTLGQPPGLDRKPRLVRLPVCYDTDFATDMQDVCEHTGLSVEEVIERHCAPRYLAHMLGFTPGFLYLGGLDEKLHCPRKASPALRVAAGSVGIGGSQTGIYPQATPGGWQVIGRTPVKLFRPESEAPFIAEPLDRIQFVCIDRDTFERLEKEELDSVEWREERGKAP